MGERTDETFDRAGHLLIVGGGRMGEALAGGLLGRGWPADRLAVVETAPGRREELLGNHRGLVVEGTVEAAGARLAAGGPGPDWGAAGAVVAVKPHDVTGVCAGLDSLGVGRVLSIAAGVSLADMEAVMGRAAVLRAMPNTPALVGAGAAAVSAGTRAGPDDVAWASAILGAIGTVVELPETSLDAVTGLSGSGPAYVFLVAEAMVDAGVLAGLTRPVARQLAVQTLLGSARLLAETGEEASALRAAVTSPGGTTAAGLRALEAAGVRSAFLDAVMAAAQRAQELGRPH